MQCDGHSNGGTVVVKVEDDGYHGNSLAPVDAIGQFEGCKESLLDNQRGC